ncbi:MAG: type II secretion system protein GspN [Myxococcales bacterium]|nr:type II secretion system protein GspN [Myxococcales bacterium]
MTVSPRARAILRIVGYVALALVTFVVALHLTFPYDRIRDRALEALSSKYDVTIGGVERSLVPGRFALTAVTLRSRAAVAGQPTTTMYFKRVEIDLAFAPLLSGKVEIGLDIATGTGRITGTIAQQKNETSFAFALSKVPLTMIPGVSDAIGLPMSGNADGKVRLKLVKNDWSKADGVFELACTVGCAVGDGEAKIYPSSKRPGDEVWTKDGVVVPALRIGRFKLAIDVVKGEARRRTFELTSADGEADVDVTIKLARVITDSTITGCIKYKCSKELYDREAKFRSTCDFGSPIIDAQGMHHIKLMGKLSNVRRIGALCDGARDDTGSSGSSGSSGNDRPRIEAPPIEPIRIIDAGVPVPVPVPEVEAPGPSPTFDPVMGRQIHDDVPPPPKPEEGGGVGPGVAPPPAMPPPPVVAQPPARGDGVTAPYPSDSARPNEATPPSDNTP